MKKQKVLYGIIATMVCSTLMISGCTQQQNSSSNESIQTILAKAADIGSVYYELAISTTFGGISTQTKTMKIWQKTPYLKEEVTSYAAGTTTSQTVIKRPDGIYQYDPTQNKYVLSSVVIPQQSVGDTARDLLNNQTITNLGTETINGKTATIIQYTVSTATTVTMWIWNEKGVPLKANHTATTEEITLTMDYEYSNYSFSDIPDSIFSVT